MIATGNGKSNNSLKVKNDNDPITFFIDHFSFPKSFQYRTTFYP